MNSCIPKTSCGGWQFSRIIPSASTTKKDIKSPCVVSLSDLLCLLTEPLYFHLLRLHDVPIPNRRRLSIQLSHNWLYYELDLILYAAIDWKWTNWNSRNTNADGDKRNHHYNRLLFGFLRIIPANDHSAMILSPYLPVRL